MRQTGAQQSYVGSASVPRACFHNARGALLSSQGPIPTCRINVTGARKGFTLIEVVVAMAILVIVVLAMLSSYSFFYSSVTNLRLQSIGENLAQLQLEDVRNMGITGFQQVLGGKWNASSSPAVPLGWPTRSPAASHYSNYPAAELFYPDPSNLSDVKWYPYERAVPGQPIGPSNLPTYDASNQLIWPTPSSVSVLPSTSLVESLASITYYKNDGTPKTYDSGIVDADFFLEGLTSFSISDVSSSSPSNLVLPDTITVAPSPSALGEYTLDISKWTYPYLKKRVTITDESPGESEPARKLYEVAVTVYWTGTANGTQKSYTVKQKVSFEGQVK